MVKVLILENEKGQYIDKENKRYNLIYGTYVVGSRADEFQEFDNIEQAMEAYGLTEVKDEQQ